MTRKEQRAAEFAELEQIRAKNGGILLPPKVVEFAKNPKTALHKRFNWDLRKAAYEHWLWQARELITVYVIVIESHPKPVQAFVNLRTDHKNSGGYRHIVDVMTDKDMRKELLAEALEDAERWRAKYTNLTELVPIFRALARIRQTAA